MISTDQRNAPVSLEAYRLKRRAAARVATYGSSPDRRREIMFLAVAGAAIIMVLTAPLLYAYGKVTLRDRQPASLKIVK